MHEHPFLYCTSFLAYLLHKAHTIPEIGGTFFGRNMLEHMEEEQRAFPGPAYLGGTSARRKHLGEIQDKPAKRMEDAHGTC